MTLTLTAEVLKASFEDLRRCGAGERECVVLWTGPQDRAGFVDGVVQPPHTASAAHYDIPAEWIGEFWGQLAAERRTVRAQVHTHPRDAYHSPRDDRLALVHIAGYCSLVIPRFAEGSVGLKDAYLAVRDEDGKWQHADAARFIEVVR
jgi:hypothetical protein